MEERLASRTRVVRACGSLARLVLAAAALWFGWPSGPAFGQAAVPRAGGLTALPEEKAEPVPLADPGFEDGASGWKLDGLGVFSIVTGQGHTGNACLKEDTSKVTRIYPFATLLLPKVVESGIYTIRFWAKCEGIEKPKQGAAGPRVCLDYQRQDGRGRGAGSSPILTGTFDWKQVEMKLFIPADFKPGTARLSVQRYGQPASGAALFDDFSMERVAPHPIEAFLLYPNYRGYLPEDGPQTVRVWVRKRKEHANEAASAEVLEAATGKTLASAALPADATEGVVSLDATSWPLGEFLLRARLGDSRYPAYHLVRISAEQRLAMGAWFDPHNVLSLKGTPTFPIGFYNTILKFGEVGPSEIERLSKMAEAPANLNINYTWWICSMDVRRRYLGEMQRHGIWYLDSVQMLFPGAHIGGRDLEIANEEWRRLGGRLDTPETCDAYTTWLASRQRQIPGHAGWYVMDERAFSDVPRTFHLCQVLRAADPDHPTYGVSNRPGELAFWRDTVDVLGMDPYPLFNMALQTPLTLVGDWTRAAVDATHGSRPVWMVLQFFQGWSKDRWPTEEELRTMSLMAITEGARGLFYWSFGTRALAWAPADKREEYWQRAVHVTKEIKSLEPALLAPDAPDAVQAVSDPAVRWRARAAGGKWFVFAYLPAQKFNDRIEKPPVEVTFTLKDGQKVTRPFRPDTADWFQATPIGR